MRIVFMGTPDIAASCLEALYAAGHDICAVYTRRDKPVGRKQVLTPPPVKQVALAHGAPVFQPRTLRDGGENANLQALAPDLIVVVAYGCILPQAVLDIPKFGCINLHVSLLPKYRGAAPIQWAILEGETVTGVTTMQMDEGLDTGDMILKIEVPIAENETGESLHDKLAAAGAELCVKTLKALEDHTAVLEKQGESPTAYAKMLDKKMGDIDWSCPAVQIERLVRGLNSWPSAYTHWQGKTLKIWRAKAENTAGAKNGTESGCLPGTVTEVGKDSFAVQTGEGVLHVYELQIPGKKRMETGAFLRGYALERGTVFTRE